LPSNDLRRMLQHRAATFELAADAVLLIGDSCVGVRRMFVHSDSLERCGTSTFPSQIPPRHPADALFLTKRGTDAEASVPRFRQALWRHPVGARTAPHSIDGQQGAGVGELLQNLVLTLGPVPVRD